ncbi:hypothetical protein AB833_30800 [Chromatiales bacterium (ex Bugula neritina AB1)]|nr:hypothetical protein AB833_30800 [Chromatiales bacterium (ex Bugula neritina AB1)]
MNITSQPARCRDELPIARFKQSPGDFKVCELLGFELDGEGEHLWISVSKTGLNTRDVVDQLADIFNTTARDIGYSGLKDKNAITTQWFSVPLAIGLEVPVEIYSIDHTKIARTTRSRKKLRSGSHRHNHFQITLRDLHDCREYLEPRLQRVRDEGFPNYFGKQRFGHGGRNVISARSMFQRKQKLSRFKRGIYLSAARSYLFNKVLDVRVAQENWQTVLPGEVCVLDGSNSVFHCALPDDEIHQRHVDFDLHTSGPLHGRGRSLVTDAVQQLELRCLEGEEILMAGLEQAGLKQERRALRAIAQDLSWRWLDETTLEIEVKLQRGVYATSLLEELVVLQENENAPIAADSDTGDAE